MDSYSIETGKNVINSSVISTFNNRKSYSETNRNNGTIEAVSPITINGSIIGVVIVDTDISEAVSFKDEIYAKINIVVIGIVALIFTFAYIIAKIFGRSFKKAFAVVADIANGHIEKRIEPSGSTELKDFAECFNVIMDKASAQDESRQEFVSNVSHELRTPITSIKVLADSLNMQDDVPIELYKEFMQDITKEIDRESKIITDLLTLVKMDKKSAAMNIEEIKINDLLEVILKRVTPIAKSRGIQITYESYRDVTAWVDEVKLSLALTNIIENAVKYNVDNGWVKVTLNADHRNFYVKVADSGVGIPDDCKEHVFERFYRVDKARSRDTGGTGLGLAITKSVIQMHKGSIKLYSESGEGTTFTIRIPMKSDASVDTARKEGDAE